MRTISVVETTRGWEARYKEGRGVKTAQTFDAPDQDNFLTAANFALRAAGMPYEVTAAPQPKDNPTTTEAVTGVGV